MFLSFSNVASVESRSSYKSRTIETGNSFLEGLELPQNTFVDDSKSIYYKNEFGCDRYEQEVSVCLNSAFFSDFKTWDQLYI